MDVSSGHYTSYSVFTHYMGCLDFSDFWIIYLLYSVFYTFICEIVIFIFVIINILQCHQKKYEQKVDLLGRKFCVNVWKMYS